VEGKEIVVYIIRRNTVCSKCKEDLNSGSFIYLEKGQPLCLSCADLDHLDFLPSGNHALTRRAIKFSKLHAIVVRWSQTRKRYERQGILAEPEAIQKAEEACLADEEFRKIRQERERRRREELDKKYIAEFARELRRLFPKMPESEEEKISMYACKKYTGRIGRSELAKKFDRMALELAVISHIRHNYTDYDELLMKGLDRSLAREEVKEKVEKIMNKWRG
jgi:hypothetical protein